MLLQLLDRAPDDLEGSFSSYRKLALALLLRRLNHLGDPKLKAQDQPLDDLLADNEGPLEIFSESQVPRSRVRR